MKNQNRNEQINASITELNRITALMNELAKAYPAIVEDSKKMTALIKERDEASHNLHLLYEVKTYTDAAQIKLNKRISETPFHKIRAIAELKKQRRDNSKTLEHIKILEIDLKGNLYSAQMNLDAFLIVHPHADSLALFERRFKQIVTTMYNPNIEKFNKLMNVEFPKKDENKISSTPYFVMVKEEPIAQPEQSEQEM